ncbi:hypothetical protein EV643_101117 [Kribbella sp. VKM Ac-2527]|uniref:Uncharacterized protein n=1 Tax=Kribbella caucasensis TaxID=2512215 RepID=A0A4R6KNW7_9ACTN|nr:hypothetical protein [Kribbella sp. VKM Ac-2527]TDO54336.1 hypothetical protein EV643_101117 [Kribbella sp. VKM Ac-2527]
MTWGVTLRKILSFTVSLAVIGLATGCGGSGDDAAPSTTQSSTTPTQTTPTASTTTTSASPPPTTTGPLTGAQYQAVLSDLDRKIAADVALLTSAKSGENLNQAVGALTSTLSEESFAVGQLRLQANVIPANKTLQARLRAASAALSATDGIEGDAKCGGVVYTSQAVQRKLKADLAAAITALRRFGLRFGTTLPDVGPEPADQRPSNGDILVRSGSRGLGRLQVKNGTDKDVAVSIVTDGKPPRTPHVMMYVQAKKTATVNRIGGKYHIYFKGGTDWNPKRRQFSSDCSFQKFDQGFNRNEGWQIDLQPTFLGNASTSEVDAY